MIRSFLFAALLVLPFSSVRSAEETPAAAAEREAAEEREKRVNARMEDMEKTVQTYEKRISALNEEIRSLRDEIGKVRDSNSDSQTRESVKRLRDAIEEVDKKRLEDNKKVVAALEDLQGFIKKNMVSTPAVRSAPPTGTKPTHSQSTRKETENGYEYTVADKDTLLGIISKVRAAKSIKLTQKQVIDANPEVNWNLIRPGQKIFIPIPSI
jgi:TolA-binding protein